jgi:hypothetical protein
MSPNQVLLGAMLVAPITVAIAVGLVSWRPPPAAASTPADAFMQSVVARDGALGWQQLCPGAQAALPLAVLVEETAAIRTAEAASGVSVSMRFVSAQPRPEGGERRVYVATARLPRDRDEQLIQKTFVVRTQASGCVEALE